ncbi:hypothetical protein HPB49_005675 [Dermacentor silvarum]|uniref:Uncharacterized protein n=1 Tax=Dermacentor silvarum TaxID=543639 RepID=A0ACB8C7H5_DERSI|nr:hypothetical protein HPB49_005675 [Dermacentor silvarum]
MMITRSARLLTSFQKSLSVSGRIDRKNPEGSVWKEGIVVSRKEVEAFITRCMRKVGTDKTHAEALANVLVTGDYRGHFSHGLNRLQRYVTDIQKGACERSGEPVVIKEFAATALVDGKNLLGPVVGTFCMKLAMLKAKHAGIGWIVARGNIQQYICQKHMAHVIAAKCLKWISTLDIDLQRRVRNCYSPHL